MTQPEDKMVQPPRLDGGASGTHVTLEQRVFSALEVVCATVSFLTILLLLPLTIFFSYSGREIALWFPAVLTILLSAAVGYVTNYIAIQMLFKPYEKNPFHVLSLLTLGVWQQGLIPRNKDAIAAELGRVTQDELIGPDSLKRQVLLFATGGQKQPASCKDPSTPAVDRSRQTWNIIRLALLKNEENIIATLGPRFKVMLLDGLRGENVDKPVSGSGGHGTSVSTDPYFDLRKIVSVAAKNATQLAVNVCFDAQFRKFIHNILEDPDAFSRVSEEMPTLVQDIIDCISDDDWKELHGMLGISGMVEESIHRQDIREFHAMINRISAQHLGAIQVLGYILGAIIGFVQIFLKLS